MQRFLTHLTLIAYLVGGWLLPANHHHASQTETHSHAPAGCCCHSADHHHEAEHSWSVGSDVCGVDIACTPTHACDCGHDAVTDQRIVDAVISSSRTQPHDCVGLCAGCAAQSLVGTHVGDRAEWMWNANVDSAVLADPGLVVSERYGFALARGPPAV